MLCGESLHGPNLHARKTQATATAVDKDAWCAVTISSGLLALASANGMAPSWGCAAPLGASVPGFLRLTLAEYKF